MFKQDADEELDGVADAQDVKELEQVVVEEGQLLRHLRHAQRDGVAQAPEPDGLSRTGQRDVVQKVVDETLEDLEMRRTADVSWTVL